jgi:hypothetical protein
MDIQNIVPNIEPEEKCCVESGCSLGRCPDSPRFRRLVAKAGWINEPHDDCNISKYQVYNGKLGSAEPYFLSKITEPESLVLKD